MANTEQSSDPTKWNTLGHHITHRGFIDGFLGSSHGKMDSAKGVNKSSWSRGTSDDIEAKKCSPAQCAMLDF